VSCQCPCCQPKKTNPKPSGKWVRGNTGWDEELKRAEHGWIFIPDPPHTDSGRRDRDQGGPHM